MQFEIIAVMFPTPARPYIPQRPPIVLVDNLLSCNEEVVVTDFHIPSDHVLVENGFLSEAGLIENIAQTCAARIGWINRDKPIPIGVIGAVNNFEYTALPAAGETITTTVTVTSAVFEAIIVHAEIQCNGLPLAQCDMKVFVRTIEVENF